MARRTDRVQRLADAVAAAFGAAGYSPNELLQGPIAVTDLPWQCPPLECKALLRGVPFHEWLDYPVGVDSQALFEFCKGALYSLQAAPELCTDSGGYTGLRFVMPMASTGTRKLQLPLPEGWPVIGANTGPILAMECARLFRTSGRCDAFVVDADNYYAATEWGPVGVVDGLPSSSENLWDVNFKGLVPAMLEQPRGVVNTLCEYDALARLRSALYESPERFPQFEAVDWALQALRIFTDGGNCREIHRAVQGMSAAAFKRKQRLQAFEHALETMQSWHITDRMKISILQEILMPSHLTLAAFGHKVLDPRKMLPSVLSTKTETRIIKFLQTEIQAIKDAERASNPEST